MHRFWTWTPWRPGQKWLPVSTVKMCIRDRDSPFKSYITFELLQDSDDRERQSLGHRRMYKKLAPQLSLIHIYSWALTNGLQIWLVALNGTVCGKNGIMTVGHRKIRMQLYQSVSVVTMQKLMKQLQVIGWKMQVLCVWNIWRLVTIYLKINFTISCSTMFGSL